MKIPKKPVCPYCGSQNVSYILYGMPAPDSELDRLIDIGEVILGGCIVFEESEQWHCQDCKETFGELTNYEEG